MEINDTPLLPASIFIRSSQYTTTIDNNKSNIIFELNSPIVSYPNTELLFSLESFKFTNSFYTINENNCNFYFSYASAVYHVPLEKGNYDIDSLIEYLNSLMSGSFFVFSYSLSTLKITISNVTPFKLVAGINNCYELLGFDDIPTSTTFVTTMTAPYLLNMMGVQVLHIVCPNVNIQSIGLKNTPKYNILASIQVLVSSGQTQTYMNSNNFRYKVTDNSITFINLVIYDQDFNIVDFNNIDWFCTLNVSHSYVKPFIKSSYLDSGESLAEFVLLQHERDKIKNEINNNII